MLTQYKIAYIAQLYQTKEEEKVTRHLNIRLHDASLALWFGR